MEPASGRRKLKISVIPITNGSVLLTFATLAMLLSSQTTHCFALVMHNYKPKNQREAMASANASDWIKAEHLELRTVWNLGTFKILDLSKHVAPIPSKFVYKNKRDLDGNICQRKVRIVARGDMQYEDEYNNTYLPTSKFTAIRTIISCACQQDMELYHWDIQGAFMTSTLDTEVFIDLPPGYSLPEGKCISLSKSLYGLKQSRALFHDTLEAWLLEYGFTAVGADGVIFKLDRGDETMMLSLQVYVDDSICASSSLVLYDQFVQDLLKRFKLSDQGRLAWYLGVAIDYNKAACIVTMCQEKYIEMLLELFNMLPCKLETRPFEPGGHLLKSDAPATPNPEQIKNYQQRIGGLMWASTFTRPDISYAVNQCAKHMANPGMKGLKLTYRCSSGDEANQLVCYTDVDHAGDPEMRKMRQQATALSTAEAEYYAASVCGTEMTYVQRMMEELGYEHQAQTVLYKDNMACIYMSRTSFMYHKVLHINTRVYHLRELCKNKMMALEKVSAAREQVADSLTKGTPGPTFVKHQAAMMGHNVLGAGPTLTHV
eukprot:1770859-Rhodomonas_salina.1